MNEKHQNLFKISADNGRLKIRKSLSTTYIYIRTRVHSNMYIFVVKIA